MSKKIEYDESVLNAMVDLEGFTIEEAKLTYAQRQKLPTSAFCGPNRTYPAHDPLRIRNAIVRLMTFKPTGWKKILGCVCRRAKKAGVKSAICEKYGFAVAKKTQESKEFSEAKKLIDWYLKGKVTDLCSEC